MNPALIWPNLLTFSRVLLVIPFIIYFPDPEMRGLWAVGLLILCELTDAFDGMLARGLGAVSNFGKLFDPFSDSVYRLTAFLTLLLAGAFPWWAFLALLFRDVAVSYIRVFEATHGNVRAARLSGKIKAIVQGVGLIVLTVFAIYGAQWDTAMIKPAMLFTYIAIVGVTLWSLFDYAQPLFAAVKAESEKP
jgi:CDP-diacylglycerol--glycerol-3-phosphate 3-phosphatidyltransferase